jgi:hypothetical protein
VTQVDVIVNGELKSKYNSKKIELMEKNKEVKEEWGFHGTSSESILKIASSGFLLPDEIAKLKAKAANGKKKGAKKVKPVELLDDGYYGKGIYFTVYSDYA